MGDILGYIQRWETSKVIDRDGRHLRLYTEMGDILGYTQR